MPLAALRGVLAGQAPNEPQEGVYAGKRGVRVSSAYK